MSTVHTSDLDHGLATALHDTHSTFIEINRVEVPDGEPPRYVVMFSHRYSVAATSLVEALAAATESLRAAMGARDVEQQRQRAEQAVADRDRWIARTVKAEDQLDGAAWDELTYERDRLRGEAGALAELVQQLARRAEKAETALAALDTTEVSDA